MIIPTYRVNSFGSDPFSGNPACVCLLDSFLEEQLMLKIARENKTAETAFVVPTEQFDAYKIRWFSSSQEIDLCGHGALAAVHILSQKNSIIKDCTLLTKSGRHIVNIEKDIYTLNFPALHCEEVSIEDELTTALGLRPIKCLIGRSIVAIYDDEYCVKNVIPKQQILQQITHRLSKRSIIITAPGLDHYDYVLRYFTPFETDIEDAVTGVAQCTLVPYWHDKLKKAELSARQLSPRGGDIVCSLKEDSVKIKGGAYTYFTGEIII